MPLEQLRELTALFYRPSAFFENVRQESGLRRPVSFMLVALILSEVVRLDNYLTIRLWPAETVLGAISRILVGGAEILVLSLALWALARLFGYRGRFAQLFRIPAYLTALVPCVVLVANFDYLIEAAFVSRVPAFIALKVLTGLALGWGLFWFVRVLRLYTGLSASRLVPLLTLFFPTMAVIAAVLFLLGAGLRVIAQSLLIG